MGKGSGGGGGKGYGLHIDDGMYGVFRETGWNRVDLLGWAGRAGFIIVEMRMGLWFC